MAKDKWNWKALAVAFAIFWGVYLGLAAWFASAGINIWWFSSESFSLLASIYPGLTATTGGIFIGLFYGAICGAFCGGILAGLYNWAGTKLK